MDENELDSIFEDAGFEVDDEPAEAAASADDDTDINALKGEIKRLREANAKRDAREMAEKVEIARSKFVATLPDNFKGVAAVALAGSEDLKTLKKNMEVVKALVGDAVVPAPDAELSGEKAAEDAAEEDNDAFAPVGEGVAPSVKTTAEQRRAALAEAVANTGDPVALGELMALDHPGTIWGMLKKE